MNSSISYTLNVGGRLLDLSQPRIMGILNVTPDSFFAPSRQETEVAVCRQVEKMLTEGADIIDVGACSTRPSSVPVEADEELRRLRMGLQAIRQVASGAVVSVDTFRADVARVAVEELGAQLINDVSGGQDDGMFPLVAELGVPYVFTLNAELRGEVECRIQNAEFPCGEKTSSCQPKSAFYIPNSALNKLQALRSLGVKDIILDPGFGFGKTLEENYDVMRHLADLQTLDLPLLVGVSRKSMICKLLNCTPNEALNGTTVLHTFALLQGAHILRVHDVREAREAIKIVKNLIE